MYAITVKIPGHGTLYKAGFKSIEEAWDYYKKRCREDSATEIHIHYFED